MTCLGRGRPMPERWMRVVSYTLPQMTVGQPLRFAFSVRPAGAWLFGLVSDEDARSISNL